MEPRALIAILGELALLQHKIVLTQGDRYWRIDDLLDQARRDRHRDAAQRDHLEALSYGVVTDEKGKLSIRNLKSGSIIFSEVGAVEPAPDPE